MKRPVADCPHGAADLTPRRRGLVSRLLGARPRVACDECGGKEDLRVCQMCGYVGCCESHDAHDTAHFEKTGHFFIRPRTGSDWLWCYGCRAYLE
ncbi:MAG TPA: UBP-type zinc finger domain-containing protein [Thermoanaerobaculia bacterium]